MDREITLHSRLSHPNIISLYAAFQDAEGIYLVLVLPIPSNTCSQCNLLQT